MFTKKRLFALALLAGVVGVMSAPAVSHATTTVFGSDAVDVDFLASIVAYIGVLFNELSLLVVLLIGLPIGFWAVRKLISFVRLR